MSRLFNLRRLGGDQSGATIVEFAMVLPVMCVLLLGTLDLGYRAYATSIIQGALHEAARMATVGGVPTSAIESHVRFRLREFSNNATITTTTRSYTDFNGVRVPESITSDTAPIGTYNPGDCFRDENNNGAYDLDRGRGGMGGSEDVVHFEVRMTYQRILPIGGFMGGNWNNNVTVTQNTILRNQPYAARSVPTPPVVCS